jgi:hypothetical protein
MGQVIEESDVLHLTGRGVVGNVGGGRLVFHIILMDLI